MAMLINISGHIPPTVLCVVCRVLTLLAVVCCFRALVGQMDSYLLPLEVMGLHQSHQGTVPIGVISMSVLA